MRAILFFIVAILFSFPALADEYTIESQFPDFQPGDGYFEAGSPLNPFVIKNEYGEEVGTIKTRLPDFTPGDGFMEPGSQLNPFVIETEN